MTTRHLLLLLLLPPWATAAVLVGPAAPITHFVQVQPIRVHKTTGQTANFFGTPTTEAYIKTQINRIWAQLGVRIDWLPVTEHTDDFIFDGSPASYTSTPRPPSDLNLIINTAGAPPKHPDPIVINLFLVGITPQYQQIPSNAAAGLAFVDYNGITATIGSDLFGSFAGLDLIASVIAHEIGHNLGLEHTPNGGANLMGSPTRTSSELTPQQKTTIFSDYTGLDGYDLLQPLPPPSNYSQWAAAHHLTGGPAADDDLDGIPNLTEFMLALDPRAFDTLPTPALSPDGLTWTLPKQPAALADGLSYHVETSADLLTWLAAGSAGSASSVLLDTADTLIVRLAPGSPARFMRLNTPVPADEIQGSASVPPASSPAARTPSPSSRPLTLPGHCGCGHLHHH